jgi:hypothetical protein
VIGFAVVLDSPWRIVNLAVAGRFAMKAIADTMGVARYHLVERMKPAQFPRLSGTYQGIVAVSVAERELQKKRAADKIRAGFVS